MSPLTYYQNLGNTSEWKLHEKKDPVSQVIKNLDPLTSSGFCVYWPIACYIQRHCGDCSVDFMLTMTTSSVGFLRLIINTCI